MALYFFRKIRTHIAQTEPDTVFRREVVCKYLMDNYKVRRNTDDEVYAKILAELQADDVVISLSTYQADKTLLRTAYQWLMAATEEDKQKIYDKAWGAKIILNQMIKDNIRTWTDLNLGAAPLEEVVGEAAEESPEEPEPPARLNLEDCTAGKEVVQITEMLKDGLTAMINENAQLLAENARIKIENAELVEKAEESETYNRFADDANAELEDKLRATTDGLKRLDGITLEEIAEKHPEYPQLAEIAQKLKDGQGRRQEAIRELMRRLPREFVWANDRGLIEYQPIFLKALAELTPDEQGQTVKQIELLATKGMEYQSLQSRKSKSRLPNSPIGCFRSRAADDIRFTWTKNGRVTVFWVWRKGNSRVGDVEA